MKNSLRAVNDRFEDADFEPPPVRVVVAEGDEDVTIKASSSDQRTQHVCVSFTRQICRFHAAATAFSSHICTAQALTPSMLLGTIELPLAYGCSTPEYCWSRMMWFLSRPSTHMVVFLSVAHPALGCRPTLQANTRVFATPPARWMWMMASRRPCAAQPSMPIMLGE